MFSIDGLQVSHATRMVLLFPTRQNQQYDQHPTQMTGHPSKTMQHSTSLNSSSKMIRRQHVELIRSCTLCQTCWQFMTTDLPFSITRTYIKQLMTYLLVACHGNLSCSHMRGLSQQQMFQNGWMQSTLSGSMIPTNFSCRCSRIRTS